MTAISSAPTGRGWISGSYWAAGVPEDVVRRSIENSLYFGLYRGEEQAGFARVVTDRATFAYLADVFVLEEHRGRGLGKRLVEAVVSHPDLQGLRRWMPFTDLAYPGIFMERKDASYGV